MFRLVERLELDLLVREHLRDQLLVLVRQRQDQGSADLLTRAVFAFLELVGCWRSVPCPLSAARTIANKQEALSIMTHNSQ